jgi:hypothetical protein
MNVGTGHNEGTKSVIARQACISWWSCGYLTLTTSGAGQ